MVLGKQLPVQWFQSDANLKLLHALGMKKEVVPPEWLLLCAQHLDSQKGVWVSQEIRRMSFHLVEHLSHHLALKMPGQKDALRKAAQLHVFVAQHISDLQKETQRSQELTSEAFFAHQAGRPLKLSTAKGTCFAESQKVLWSNFPVAFHKDPDGSAPTQLEHLMESGAKAMESELGAHVSASSVGLPLIIAHIRNLCTYPHPDDEQLVVGISTAFYQHLELCWRLCKRGSAPLEGLDENLRCVPVEVVDAANIPEHNSVTLAAARNLQFGNKF